MTKQLGSDKLWKELFPVSETDDRMEFTFSCPPPHPTTADGTDMSKTMSHNTSSSFMGLAPPLLSDPQITPHGSSEVADSRSKTMSQGPGTNDLMGSASVPLPHQQMTSDMNREKTEQQLEQKDNVDPRWYVKKEEEWIQKWIDRVRNGQDNFETME